MRASTAWLLVCASVLAGCGDNELGVEKVRPNQPPETELSSGPPDSTDATNYRVHLFWSGTDRDGTIDHYDFILVDHPPIQNHIDGDPGDDDPTRVIINIPLPDDPRWAGTTASDSTFLSLADSLLREPRPGEGETPGDVLEQPFERWHTFFVRAVDNEGFPDQTPDYRSFNSNNIAPTVELQHPIVAGDNEFTGPPVIVFNWEGNDPVDETTDIDPVASRWVIISTQVIVGGSGDRYINFPDSLYVLPTRYKWSPWRAWDAEDGSGKRAVVSNLNQVGDFEGSGYYIFAVQAMDEAGAITPVFDYRTAAKNNCVRVRVSGAVGPLLTVRETFLGRQTFIGGRPPVRVDVAGGQPLNFRWSADADTYGGEIIAYRYGWDIKNTDNDQEWSSWSLSTRSAPPQSFSTGSHRFFLEVRDNAESITRATYELTVHTVTRSRDILWVDDSDYQTDIGAESQEDARWINVLNQVALANGFTFEPTLDIYDVRENRTTPPPIAKIFDYKTVVWSTRSGRDGSSALRATAQFSDPIPVRSQNTAKAFNFINIYLGNRGTLWINGFRPAGQLWPTERLPAEVKDPVNVTNWDDPIEQHPPGIDSVGTSSLLFHMGIEMFDVGASLEIDRQRAQYYCYGFERCEVASADMQHTQSSLVESHRHSVLILTSEVEAFPPVDRTYTTTTELEHTHTLTLTSADFIALQRGETVMVTSSSADLPQPHTHSFDIVDQVGLWGAPTLRVGSQWGLAGTGGRPNVEIYNMPNALAGETPPLVPLPGISLGVYCYVAQLREDPATNYFYPQTSDNQPGVVLAKGLPSDAYYSRAFCGFEPSLLEELSHNRLLQFIVVRHFRLGGGAP